MKAPSGAVFTTTLNDSGRQPAQTAPAAPYLFVVLHGDFPLAGGARYSLRDVDRICIGRGPVRDASRFTADDEPQLRIDLPGGFVSGTHATIRRHDDRWLLEDAHSRNGCFINGERVTQAFLIDGDFIEIGHTIVRFRTSLATPEDGDDESDLDLVPRSPQERGLVTLLPQLGAEIGPLKRIADSTVSVLLLGPTGTGKEVLAHAIHRISQRPGQLVAVNCGGLTASLLESQLFGHVRGAFTGAHRDEPGYIRAAHEGTLFLDEIGDLPHSAQAALLRVIQESQVTPVGATRAIDVSLRIVSATHRPLDELSRGGLFRADLLARLSGYRHELAPLSERREDLGLLLADILPRCRGAQNEPLRLDPLAARLLLRHHWPLNIRELYQCISSAAVLASENGVILPRHLPASVNRTRSSRQEALDPQDKLRVTLLALLERHAGNITQVARQMGKSRIQIHRWLQRFQLDPEKFRKI